MRSIKWDKYQEFHSQGPVLAFAVNAEQTKVRNRTFDKNPKKFVNKLPVGYTAKPYRLIALPEKHLNPIR